MAEPAWRELELRARLLTGGKLTPGSGNKNIKGDVVLPSVIIECKYSSQETFTIQYEWLRRLELFNPSKECILYCGTKTRNFCYYLSRSTSRPQSWKTRTLHINKLPLFIGTEAFVWTLEDEDFLRQFR